MARKSYISETGERFTINYPNPGEYVNVGQYKLPRRFSAEFPARHVRLELAADSGRRAECVGISKLQNDGPALTGTLLRELPLATMVQQAFQTAAVGEDPEGGLAHVLGIHGKPGIDEVAATLRQQRQQQQPRPYRTSEEDLQKVADAYRAALRTRTQTGKAVARAMHVQPSSARRLILRARQRGFLGATQPRTAGEF